MARPKKAIEPILASGMSVMYQKGYHATGMQDLANASGMTKGAIYGYFKSKEDFAVKALAMYTQKMVSHLEHVLLKGNRPAVERIRVLLTDWSSRLFNEHNGCGCFAGNMAQEMSSGSEAIREASAQSFNTLEAIYRRCLEQAVTEGALPESFDTAQAASIIYNGWQGALMRAKAEKSTQYLEQYINWIYSHLLK